MFDIRLIRENPNSVEENLKTGFAPLARNDRSIPDDVFSLFPVLNSMLSRRGGVLSGTAVRGFRKRKWLVLQPAHSRDICAACLQKIR